MAKAPDDPNAPNEPQQGRRPAPKQKPARDPAKHSKKDPARPTRGKAARPDSAADRPGARGAAQSRHRPGHRRAGLADRAEAAGGQFVRPPRRFFRRAPRAQIDRGSARRRRRATAARVRHRRMRRRSDVDSELAQALGFEGDDAAPTAPPRTRTPSRPIAASPAPPPRCRRWKRCCARAARNSASGRGRRTARRGRKNPKAASRW